MHSAFAKSAINRLLSRNYLPLTAKERLHFIAQSGIGRFHVATASISGAATRPSEPKSEASQKTKLDSQLYKHTVINYSPVTSRPISVDERYKFLAALVDGRSYQNTELYERFRGGEIVTRVVDTKPFRTRITIQTEDDFENYYLSCALLIESIRKYGVLDLRSDEPNEAIHALRNTHRDGKVSAIGVAIDGVGNLFHRRKGHHRLAVAKLLGVDRIPVTVEYMSGTYFRAFSSKTDLLTERRFVLAIREAATAAIESHS